MSIQILGPKDRKHPEAKFALNTTSTASNWSRRLSPFFLGPVELYNGFMSKNVENAWQFSKVYNKNGHFDRERWEPTEAYFTWARNSWNSTRAERYPMGKGSIPMFSFWNGEHYTYLEARIKIYAPLYAQAARKSEAFQQLVDVYSPNKHVVLFDFDGYDNITEPKSWEQIILDPTKKMGHAFVLGMMLENCLEDVLASSWQKLMQSK